MNENIDKGIVGDGGAAIIEFAEAHLTPTIQTFKDPEGIAPDVTLIVGRDKEGATAAQVVKFASDAYRPRPIRRKGSIMVTTLASFVDLTNRQSGEASVIFADDSAKPSMTAVLNFHEPEVNGAPAWCDDRIRYDFPLSEEWVSWMGKNKQQMSQGDFAEWIENRLFDIGDPTVAGAITQAFAAEGGVKLAGRQTLLGLSKGLAVRVEHRVSKTVNLQSGEGRLEYSEEHKNEDGGPLVVPAAFHLFIPIVRGGARYSIPVRLRYRTSGGKVVWFFEIHRADLFLMDCVKDALETVKRDPDAAKDEQGNVVPSGCGLPVFLGSPPT